MASTTLFADYDPEDQAALSADHNATDQATLGEHGTLIVQVPHWMARVSVFDNLYQPVEQLVPVQESATEPNSFQARFQMTPGIYRVETELLGHVERELVPISPNSTTTIAKDRWQDLMAQARPGLKEIPTPREQLVEHAREWGRKTTWNMEFARSPDSRLFLFVGSVKRNPPPSFSDGLSLLDVGGRLVTDFSAGVERDREKGWLAFNADLPSGPYILRCGRRGVRTRFQPLYLSAGWETQLLLEADRYPKLDTASLTMAPVGSGLQPGDESFIVTNALVPRLGRAEATTLALNERVASLLEGTSPNVWLAVVVGYALHPALENLRSSREENAARRDARSLFKRVTKVLGKVQDHPDARAVLLKDDRPVSQTFWESPLLQVGLQRVQRHATRHPETILLDSLVDVILDSPALPSPWTAWHKLSRMPQLPTTYEPPLGTGKLMLAIAPEATPLVSPPAQYSPIAGISPDAPIFRLGSQSDPGSADMPSFNLAHESTVDPVAATLREAPVIQHAHALILADPDNHPDTIDLDLDSAVDDLLSQVHAEDISKATGQPLARSESGLENLRIRSHEPGRQTTKGFGFTQAMPAELAVERAIVDVAFRKAMRPGGGSIPIARDAEPDKVVRDAIKFASRPTTIEESVTKLRIEADRLMEQGDDPRGAADPDALRQMEIANRLDAAANALLRQADFIAITDPRKRLLYGNGAFLALLSFPDDAEADQTPDDEERMQEILDSNRARWESALAALPPGRATLDAPVRNPICQQWAVQSTEFRQSSIGEVVAYLRVLRDPTAARPTPGSLRPLEALLSELTLFAPLLAYGSPESRGDYAERLESIAGRMEGLVNAK